ncbi:hypothetical protein HYV50_05825 [Candidatus Pacearchaeota archaeon]|nr:hypothetical protein [Candidatus Pacearchaeota archaeon]
MIYIIDSYAWIEYLIASKKGELLKELFEDEQNIFLTLECCLAEIKGWSLRENQNFDDVLKIIKANSEIISITEKNWLDAAEEKFREKKKQKGLGLIGSIILAKQKEMVCKIISGDKHFMNMKNVLFMK